MAAIPLRTQENARLQVDLDCAARALQAATDGGGAAREQADAAIVVARDAEVSSGVLGSMVHTAV